MASSQLQLGLPGGNVHQLGQSGQLTLGSALQSILPGVQGSAEALGRAMSDSQYQSELEYQAWIQIHGDSYRAHYRRVLPR